MDALILLKLLCSLLILTTPSNAKLCTSAQCSPVPNSPEIRPPFRIRGIQPHECGLPGFTLLCNHQNQTMIRFNGTRDLFVKAISYHTQRLSLVDPQNCVHEVFLNLNLSLTPFSYYHAVHRYKYVNCSSKLAGIEPVPCLTASNHHVYVVEPSFPLPVSCTAVKTVAIPFSYSPYLSGDSSFGLGLTWPSSRVDEASADSSQTEYNYIVLNAVVLSMMAVVFVVGKLLYAKHGGEFNEEKVESDKLLGEYEALSRTAIIM